MLSLALSRALTHTLSLHSSWVFLCGHTSLCGSHLYKMGGWVRESPAEAEARRKVRLTSTPPPLCQCSSREGSGAGAVCGSLRPHCCPWQQCVAVSGLTAALGSRRTGSSLGAGSCSLLLSGEALLWRVASAPAMVKAQQAPLPHRGSRASLHHIAQPGPVSAVALGIVRREVRVHSDAACPQGRCCGSLQAALALQGAAAPACRPVAPQLCWLCPRALLKEEAAPGLLHIHQGQPQVAGARVCQGTVVGLEAEQRGGGGGGAGSRHTP